MKSKFTLMLIVLSAVSAMGCLSPILTHAENKKESNVTESTGIKSQADCDVAFKKQGLCVAMDWIRHPSDNETGSFTLRFWKLGQGNANGPYTDPNLSVFVRLWMPSMGHGSAPVTLSASRDSSGATVAGVYEVSQVFFVMRGKWEIQVQLKNQGELVEQASFPVQY